MSRLIQERIQFFVLHALQKLIEGFNKIWHLRVQILTVMDDVIKPEMVQQPTKLATQNLVVVLSRGNALNMALVLLKLSHLLLFMSFPSRPSAAGKLCSVCNNPIHSSYANLAYHCEDSSRDNVCRLSATSSGF